MPQFHRGNFGQALRTAATEFLYRGITIDTKIFHCVCMCRAILFTVPGSVLLYDNTKSIDEPLLFVDVDIRNCPLIRYVTLRKTEVLLGVVRSRNRQRILLCSIRMLMFQLNSDPTPNCGYGSRVRLEATVKAPPTFSGILIMASRLRCVIVISADYDFREYCSGCAVKP